jgi:hypothetical protein
VRISTVANRVRFLKELSKSAEDLKLSLSKDPKTTKVLQAAT